MRIRKTERIDLVEKLNDIIFPADPLEREDLDEYWLVYDSGEPVGFASIRPIVQDPDVAFLNRAGLLHGYYGKGLHKKLIKARLSWAKKNGYFRIITYTTRENFLSYHNLQKCGFFLYEPGYRYVGKDFLYWRYDIE